MKLCGNNHSRAKQEKLKVPRDIYCKSCDDVTGLLSDLLKNYPTF